MGKSVTHRLIERRILGYGLAAFMAILFLEALAHFSGLTAPPGAGLVDFDAFHIAGTMVREGNAAAAYDADQMFAAQEQISGTRSFMPWSYPPQFDLIVAGLAMLPLGLAFGLFVALTCAAYVWVMRRLAGGYAAAVLLAIAPALQVNLKTGQNGFLTGALVGGFCLLALRGRPLAGLPLGLMAIKPHLAVGLGLSVLVGRHWRIVAVAAAVVVLSGALATLALGGSIWPAFLKGAEQATGLLKQGSYPMFRMTSLFAALRSAGVSGELALALQGGLALVVCVLVGVVTLRLGDARVVLAVAILGSLAISPYNYDYDLTLLGVALALLAPALFARATDRDFALILGLAWVATGAGTVSVIVRGAPALITDLRVDYQPASLGFYGYAALMLVLARVLLRPARQVAPASAPPRGAEAAG